MKRRWALGLIGVWLMFCAAGCSNIGGQAYEAYLSGYSGADREALRVSWGEPVCAFDDGEQYLMVYRSESETMVMTSPAIYEPYFDGRSVHHRLVQPSRWGRATVHCETTFMLENDAVVAWRFTGSGCYAPNAAPNNRDGGTIANTTNAM